MRHWDSTKANYYRVWKNFSKFYLSLDYKPISWAERLTLFVGYLVESRKQSATVKLYVSAIKAILQDDGIEFDPDETTITSLTKACRFINDRVYRKIPIQKTLLSKIIKKLKQKYQVQPYLKMLYTVLFTSAYYRLLRISEVTGIHAVQARDVLIGTNKNNIMFLLRSSKTHWINNKPQCIKISALKLEKRQKQNKTSFPALSSH